MRKCATTVKTRYDNASNAITEVYFNESKRLKNDNGMITSLIISRTQKHQYINEVIQNCLSSKNGIDFDPGKILPTTCGIKSPMIIRYDTATPTLINTHNYNSGEIPKHFIEMAPSKITAAPGYVRFDTAKNDECPRSILNAHRDRKYNPIPDVRPANTMTQTPANTPIDDMAAGIATHKVNTPT